MERRNRSIEALNRLLYIDSLDEELKAPALVHWANKYLLDESSVLDFDLELQDLNMLLELFYKNIRFLKEFNGEIQKDLIGMRKMRTFLQNS